MYKSVNLCQLNVEEKEADVKTSDKERGLK